MEILLTVILLGMLLTLIVSRHAQQKQRRHIEENNELRYDREALHANTPLVYYGENLEFHEEVLRKVLIRHFPFFGSLLPPDQDRFLSRLKKFIHSKVFIIHDVKGYREMPILISAAAIQLTFGLEKYLFPHYTILQIYPQEFIAMEPMRVLIGNVSGNTINIAWKQFLDDYKNKFGNSNVGLHEMAHALYYQNFETEEHIDRQFTESFKLFAHLGAKIYEIERQKVVGIYTTYSMKNFQEFWAESIELFFANPQRLNSHYPELYHVLCDLLCQDTLRYPYHSYPE